MVRMAMDGTADFIFIFFALVQFIVIAAQNKFMRGIYRILSLPYKWRAMLVIGITHKYRIVKLEKKTVNAKPHTHLTVFQNMSRLTPFVWRDVKSKEEHQI